jgi:hypothetical protein
MTIHLSGQSCWQGLRIPDSVRTPAEFAALPPRGLMQQTQNLLVAVFVSHARDVVRPGAVL